MRVLLGAALVAGAYADGHRVCAAAECTTCADDFKACGGADVAHRAKDFKAADDAAATNCENSLQEIFRVGEKAGAASQAICESYGGKFTAKVDAATAVWTATVAATCQDAAGNDVGNPASEDLCEIQPTYTEATGTCAAADDTPIDDAETWTATTCAANADTNKFAIVVAASCSLGGDDTSAATCENDDQKPTFTAEVAGSCNNAAGKAADNSDVAAGAGTEANCAELKDAGSDASCSLAANKDGVKNGLYDADYDVANKGTFTGECDATKAGICMASCKDAPKKEAGSSADDGSAASPAAMIATGMAFLALFL